MAAAPIPLVLVPGILGSTLSVAPDVPVLGDRTIWLDHLAMLAGGWRWLELGSDGIDPPDPYHPPLAPGAPLGDYYGRLAQGLVERGYTVHVPRLDWRGTIARDGARLASLLRSLATGSKIHIVAHSRGGWVVRAALAQLGDTVAESLIGTVVGMGVPHLGSLAAVKVLAGWDPNFVAVRVLLTAMPGILRGGYAWSELGRILATQPAWYELLPPAGAAWLPPADQATLTDPSYYESLGLPVSAPWMQAAQAYLAAPPPVPSWCDWWDVAGRGFTTPDYLLPGMSLDQAGSLGSAGDGDGVVPYASAHPGLRPSVETPTDHAGLILDGRVLAMIDRILRGQVGGAQVIGGAAYSSGPLGAV